MTTAPVRILLVEDSPSDAALLQESLNEAGCGRFEFIRAAGWGEATERLRVVDCDVMLLDLSLPDSSGRETFLRARAAAPHLPIVVLTGTTDEAVGLEAVRQGVQDYLIKGQADGRLTARVIRYAIERNQAEAALKQAEAALRENERKLREWTVELERRVAVRTAQLEETVGDLEGFSHSITHDLRAPLRAMCAFSELLREEYRECASPAAQDYIQRIITAAARMDKLIQDVLHYSRQSRSEIQMTPVDVQELLRGIIESYPAFQAPQVEIQIEGRLPRVLGNEAALTQCFSNLLDNAVKFVAPGACPRVRIRAEVTQAAARNTQHASQPSAPGTAHPSPSPTVRIWVEDNGIGIAEAAQARIFKLFERLDTRYTGTGVGLTVVRKAVEKMGGSVGLESEPGRGSRFWLELKLAGE